MRRDRVKIQTRLLRVFQFVLVLNLVAYGSYVYLEKNPRESKSSEIPQVTTINSIEPQEEIVIAPISELVETIETEEVVEEVAVTVESVKSEYIEVTDSCGAYYEGDCLVARSGPGTDYPVITHLRNGMILKVDGKVEGDDRDWYKVVFDEWLRYPERVTADWYVTSEYVEILEDEGEKTVWKDGISSTTKRIVIERDLQILRAYENDELYLEALVSTGLELSPTPRGTFSIFKKTPSRYMQGPIMELPVSKYYDLPGVPWNLYFTEQGAVIHGSYWHNSFGSAYSNGCVNLLPDVAGDLYHWADLGTEVVVR